MEACMRDRIKKKKLSSIKTLYFVARNCIRYYCDIAKWPRVVRQLNLKSRPALRLSSFTFSLFFTIILRLYLQVTLNVFLLVFLRLITHCSSSKVLDEYSGRSQSWQDWGFRSYPQALRVNSEKEPWNEPRPTPPKSLLTSHIIQYFTPSAVAMVSLKYIIMNQ